MTLEPGRHERRGRHEAPRFTGLIEIPDRTLTPDEVGALRSEWKRLAAAGRVTFRLAEPKPPQTWIDTLKEFGRAIATEDTTSPRRIG